ncbi:MAG: SPOR domain-containing protein [Gemmatimonadetes bacterium]|nr:SPOR domain-containing protein [Gemmatimonadota bacterium]
MKGAVRIACALLGAAAPALVAQDNPALRAAVQLAAEGRGEGARRIVAAELARLPAGDSSYVEALFWRARLASSGDSAERDLRRVAIEFSASRWADDALLQLAQLAMAAGNPASALALATRLRADYPDSELRPRAAFWAGRAALELGEPQGACALLDSARAEASGDVEFQNQAAFYRGRCESVVSPHVVPVAPAPQAAPLTDSARAAPSQTAPATPSAPAVRPPGAFDVQVAAARTDQAARAIVNRLARAGHRARVLTGADGYRRIRLGPFPTLREAEEAARAAGRILGGTPFVVRGS